MDTKRRLGARRRNRMKNGQCETGSHVNGTSRPRLFQMAQIREAGLTLEAGATFPKVGNVQRSPVQTSSQKRVVCGDVGGPQRVVHSSWGNQVEEELEETNKWRVVMAEGFESPCEDGPPELAYQGHHQSPKMSPTPLETQTGCRLEGTVASADHFGGVREMCIKSEALEGSGYKSICNPHPTLMKAQRASVKEETGPGSEYPLKTQQEENISSPPTRFLSSKDAAVLEFANGLARGEEGISVRKSERIFSCPVCGKGFNQKSNLTRHHKIHTTEGPYKCGECGESFRMNRKLLRHQRTHVSEPFKCTECGRSFNQRSNLVRHQRIHTREAPYQCPECEKTFNQKGNLFRHRTIHVRMGPCNCTKCGKPFSQRRSLIKHQKLHLSDGAHKCCECGKRFRLRKYLRRHQKIHIREAPYSRKWRGDGFGLGRSDGGLHVVNEEQRAFPSVDSEETRDYHGDV